MIFAIYRINHHFGRDTYFDDNIQLHYNQNDVLERSENVNLRAKRLFSFPSGLFKDLKLKPLCQISFCSQISLKSLHNYNKIIRY